MSRPLRIEYPGATYHVMARGVCGQPIFRDEADRYFLLRLIEEQVLKKRLVVDAFSLMLNHFHFLSQTPKAGLGRWMQIILGRYGFYFNRRHGSSGHVFQGRYKALLVEDGDYYLNCFRYIHRNPEKLVVLLKDYRWSSYPNYLSLRPVADWVSTKRGMQYFLDSDHCKAFVESPRKVTDPFSEAVVGAIYGSDAFVRKTRRFLLEQQPGSEEDVIGLRHLRLWGMAPSPDRIRRIVEFQFRDFSACQRRRMSIIAMRDLGWFKNAQIAQELGMSPSAVSQAYKALRQRSESDDQLRARLQHLAHQLPPPRS